MYALFCAAAYFRSESVEICRRLCYNLNMNKIVYVALNAENFNLNCLDGFVRRQKVEECWRFNGGSYVLTPVSYTEDWNLSERRALAKRIAESVSCGSVAYAAKSDGEVVGFALVESGLFGSRKQYIDLAEFYVSEPFRRMGIGRELFNLACAAARKSGAEKLYISAHSAKETIAAYESYGCRYAEEINAELVKKEPCDLQLEYKLV